MAIGTKRIRLGELLVKAGVLTEEQLNEGLARQKETREQIGEALIQLGHVTEEKIKYALELQFGVKHINLKTARIPAELLKLFPEQMIKQYQIVPVAINQLTVALVDPNNILAIDQIRMRLKGVNVIPAVCTESDFWEILKTIPKDTPAPQPGAERVESNLQELQPYSDAQVRDLLEQAKKGGGDAAIVPLANAILSAAIKRHATSLHFEPLESGMGVRQRVEGKTVREPNLPLAIGQSIVQRIRVLAGLTGTSGHAVHTQGFAFNFENRPIRFRLHGFNVRHGQAIALRIYDSAQLNLLTLESMVLHPRALQALRAMLGRQSGMVLFGGPHGSGKSLMLYNCVKDLRQNGADVMTIEDPVEFDLEGVTQLAVPLDATGESSILHVLNNALIQHQGVVMVSDLPSAAVAQRAARAALAGNLVLAGVATTQNLLVEAKEQWHMSPRVLANALGGVVTMRTLRRLCQTCKQRFKPDERTAKYFHRHNGTGDIYNPVGCEACNKTGFAGSVGVYEILPVTPVIRELIARQAPRAHIDHALRQMGLVTAEDYAMWLVAQGYTTLDEVRHSDIQEFAQAAAMQEAASQPTNQA